MTNRIHITSSGPRTGTTLLTEVFKSCFEIDCSCDHEASIANSNSSFGDCKVLLTKYPSETYKLNTVLNYVSNLYVVCMIRDPRDMIVSFHGLDKSKYFCGLNFWFDFVNDFKNLDKHPRFIVVRYEEFTNDPDSIQRILLKKLPFLKFKRKFSEYHKYAKPNDYTLRALNVLRPIESKGVGNWKKHKLRVKQQIDKHGSLNKSLVYFNYELDAEWEKELEGLGGIEEGESVSYLDEVRDKQLINKLYFMTLFNFTCEKINLNPDRILNVVNRFRGRKI